MKTLITLVLTVLFSTVCVAQNGINYKAIIKDANGNVIANNLVVVQFSILQGVAQTNVYKEMHTPTTDANGLIILNIGEGTILSGTFSTIDWANDTTFLNTQINSGTGLVDLGTTEFKTVPYAKNAETASNVTGLEAIDEGNGIGWRLKGQDQNFYGNIGSFAVDLSSSLLPSMDKGATGSYSTAMGINTTASSYASAAIGVYNSGGGTANQWISTDPLLEVGNGISDDKRSNAMTILKNGTFIVGSDRLNIDTTFGSDNTKRMFFNKDKAAFRAGSTGVWYDGQLLNYPTAWNDENVGVGSFASGMDNEASGWASSAMGFLTVASGEGSTSMGANTAASGSYSTSMGTYSVASGQSSTAMGGYTTASSYNSLAIGRYNVGGGNGTSWVATDRLFEIGYGTSNSQRSNAFTVLKNGKVGIGISNPSTFLHITNGYNASSNNGTGYFLIGPETGTNMVFDNNEIMVRYNGAASTLYLQNNGGDVRVGGVIVHSSDGRLKKDVTPLSYGLETILELNPVEYNWKNREQDFKSLGLIAQEVQPIIENIVHATDDEDQTLSVSYTELIPVLIKAIKEQQKIINNLTTELDQLKTLDTRVKQLETLLKTLNQ